MSAEDEDGDDLTFNWEQYDAEKSIPLGDTTTLGDIIFQIWQTEQENS